MNPMTKTLSIFALGALAAGAVSAQNSPGQEVGRLQNVQGTVLIKQGEQSVPVTEGQLLFKADEILVTEGASALIVWNDGCDLELDAGEVYEVNRLSPCAMLWWAGPAAAGVACGAAHADKSDKSRDLAAVGLAVGAGLLGTAQGRETEYREFAAALESADGDVQASFENESGAQEFRNISPGTRLRADQELLVKAGSKAVIRFDDGCTSEVEVGEGEEERFMLPGNSPCFTPGMWWASSAAAAGLCLSVENEDDVASP